MPYFMDRQGLDDAGSALKNISIYNVLFIIFGHEIINKLSYYHVYHVYHIE